MPVCLINYAGPSMNPTLDAGDGLKVLPYHGRTIRPGDVVVFRSPAGRHNVVHRVVRVDGQGIRTRGDNNTEDDAWLLQLDQIIGQVVYVTRHNTTWRLAAGRSGRVLAAFARIRRSVGSCMANLLRPIYRALGTSGIFRRCLGPPAHLRIVSFARPNGVEMHLFLGRLPIGRRPAGMSPWQIRPPFRLFIDEASLPPSRLGGK